MAPIKRHVGIVSSGYNRNNRKPTVRQVRIVLRTANHRMLGKLRQKCFGLTSSSDCNAIGGTNIRKKILLSNPTAAAF
jgi:hypothetical protein